MITPAAMTGLGAPSFLHRMPRPGALVARVALDPGAQEHRAVPSVLVRPPSPNLADGELTHQERVPVDAAFALE